MGNQWGDIYLCVPSNHNVGGTCPHIPPIITAPAYQIRRENAVLTGTPCDNALADL